MKARPIIVHIRQLMDRGALEEARRLLDEAIQAAPASRKSMALYRLDEELRVYEAFNNAILDKMIADYKQDGHGDQKR